MSTEPLLCPRTPCSTCPFRRDTPPGIWAAEEYRKLPAYDPDASLIPELSVFHCHQENATGVPTVCRGWLACFGWDIVAIRLAVARGTIPAEEVSAQCSVPLYSSGAEACKVGVAGVRRPGRKARQLAAKLTRRSQKSLDDAIAQGFADCESLVVAMFNRLADDEIAKGLTHAPQGGERGFHETRATCLREAALIVSLGQHRNVETNEAAVLSAHRTAVNRAQAQAGGRAAAAKPLGTERGQVMNLTQEQWLERNC